MRIPIIAGNWKMNKTRDEALKFIYETNRSVPNPSVVETVVFAQAIHLRCLVKRQGENLRIGAQNVHYEDSGAFTGELSPIALREIGVSYCLIGHSERRSYYNETDEAVNKKIHAALKYNLKPIVCVGEVLSERENGETLQVVDRQVKIALKGLAVDQLEGITIAYEPVWAIGTGKTATPGMANETCGDIRGIIANLYSKNIADSVRILYGGSVNPNNIKDLMNEEHIDGALIGGASLIEKAYLEMVNIAKEA